MARRIEVEIIGDSRSLERAFGRSARSATVFEARMRGVSRGLSSGFKTLAGAVGVAFTFDAFVKGVEHSLNAAEDLNKALRRTRTIFGAASKTVIAWSKTTADAFGIDQAAALKAASAYGIYFDRLGKGRQVSAEMSKALVERAADVASFFNIDRATVLTGFQRALVGQARGVKQWGINISNARVQAEAYSSGIAHAGAKLTENQKVLARNNILLRDSAPAQGNATQRAKDWENVQARLKATLEDTAAAIGEKLLPKFRRFANRFENWLSNADNQKTLIDNITSAISALGTAAEAAAAGFKELRDAQSWMDKHHLHWLNYALTTPVPLQVRDAINYLQRKGAPSPSRMPGRQVPGWAYMDKTIRTGPHTGVDVSVIGANNQFWQRWGKKPPGTGGAGAGGGSRGWTWGNLTGAQQAAMRNTWFDNMVARQLDRVQDLGLRKQMARLAAIAAEVRAQIAITKDKTRRLALEDQLLGIYRQQKQVQADITDQIKQANQALKDRADAIKSAILDRLQRQQQNVENKRALQDAREQLRIALQLGGPKGIQAARRALADAKMAALITRAEGARPSLTRGGQFALGNIITINIHGVTDPDKVAKAVIAAMKRRGRHTTNQTRGPTAGVAG